MKKLLYLFSALALFSACEQSEDFGQPVQGGASGELPEVIYATVADNDQKSDDKTRTYVDGKNVLWNGGDNITYFYHKFHGAHYKHEGKDGVAEAEFTKFTEGTIDFELSRSYAIYPFEVGASCIQDNGVEKLQVFYPAEQNYIPNSFGRGANVMVAAGEHALDDNLRFRNACGYLVIKLYGENITVKSIELTALGGEKIAGKGLITASYDAAPEVEMTDQGTSTITLNCGSGVTLGADKANATEFWFAMPPTTFNEGFKIFVAPTTGMAFEMQTSKRVEITRNDIQPMAALQFTPNAQSAKQIFYTRADESTEPITFHENTEGKPFDANITRHEYDDKLGKFIIECDAPITEFRDFAFCRTQISSISLPKQLKTIGEFALATTKLKRLVIPGSVTLIKNGAFVYNRNMPSITFLWGEEILEIRDEDDIMEGVEDGFGQFSDTPLDTIYIDRNIRYTDDEGGEHAMVGNEHGLFSDRGWVHLTIGPNMSTIIESMFADCSIEKLVIPGNITSIGKNAFYLDYALKELVFEPSPTNTPLTFGNATYLLSDVSPFYLPNSSAGDKLTTIRLNREIIYTLEDVDSKDNGLFSDRRKLTTLELGEQVKTISDYMFAASEVLTSVTIPSSVTTIGKHAFADSPQLASVTIPGSVTTIGDYAFANCASLKTAIFQPSLSSTPLTVSTLSEGYGPFYNTPLQTVEINRDVRVDRTLILGRNESLFGGKETLTQVTLGEQVKKLHPYEFAGSSITSITIPSTVEEIGDNAFLECTKLATVNIEESNTPLKIGYQLVRVINGFGLTSEYGPFYDSPLKSVTLKREINYVKEDGIDFVTNGLDEWDEGLFATKHDLLLTQISLGGGLRNILPYMFANAGVSGSVWIPHTIESIGDYAFDDCDNLRGLTLGYDGTTTFPSIGTGVFDDCGSFTYIKVRNRVHEQFENAAKNNTSGWGAYGDYLRWAADFE